MTAFPQKIKHYRILSELVGQTGSLLAQDEVARRQVLLKELRPGVLATTAELHAFRAAVQTLARHPEIHAARTIELVQVRNEGKVLRYLVREFREGLSLAATLERKGPFTTEEAAHIVARVARCLAALHDAGVAHGNLSASNVILDVTGQIQLVDHGLPACAANRAYIAPEVESTQSASAAGDIYSLGALFCKLLTEGSPSPAGAHEEAVVAAGARAGVLARMLARDPSKRFDSVWTVATQLEQTRVLTPRLEASSILTRSPKPPPLSMAAQRSASMKTLAPMEGEIVPERLSESAAPRESGSRGMQRLVAVGQFFFVTWAVGFLLFEISRGAMKPAVAQAPLVAAAAGTPQAVFMTGTTVASAPAGELRGTSDAEMCAIPAGDASWVDPISNKRERVPVPAFEIDRYEVTNAEFLRFTRETGHISEGNWQRYFLPGMERYPVVGITWKDADSYAKWVGKRLPSAREWEKAAGGAEGQPFPWGATFDPSRCAWSSLQKPVPVDSFPDGKSPYGVYNMAGNVWGWVDDMTAGRRFVMGGSYNSDAQSLGTSAHLAIPAEGFRPPPDIGFRCAR